MKHIALFAAILSIAAAAPALGRALPRERPPRPSRDFLGQVDFVEGRILALNQAMADKEAWRPAEGVRSVGETYLHIAFGNYILTKMVGFNPPPRTSAWT